jgi:hypothetical protein
MVISVIIAATIPVFTLKNINNSSDNLWSIDANNNMSSCFNKSCSVGVGISDPSAAGKLFLKGFSNFPQVIIQANSSQSNTNPLIQLKSYNDAILGTIHTNDASNLFMGIDAGQVNTGLNNIGIGASALRYNTTGHHNIAINVNSLYWNSTGSYNIGVGESALSTNTTAHFNTGIGMRSIYDTRAGGENTGLDPVFFVGIILGPKMLLLDSLHPCIIYTGNQNVMLAI